MVARLVCPQAYVVFVTPFLLRFPEVFPIIFSRPQLWPLNSMVVWSWELIRGPRLVRLSLLSFALALPFRQSSQRISLCIARNIILFLLCERRAELRAKDSLPVPSPQRSLA